MEWLCYGEIIVQEHPWNGYDMVNMSVELHTNIVNMNVYLHTNNGHDMFNMIKSIHEIVLLWSEIM